MKNSKYVRDWFVTLMPNGVYTLTFNVTEKGLEYHQYSDDQYEFGEEPEDESFDDWQERIQEIPEFLPPIEDGLYIPTSMRNKDQISFYFIPFYFKYIREGEERIILNSKDLNRNDIPRIS